jgi:transposase
MDLHANAALSWTGRRRLCELVVEEGLTVAAAAAGVSVRCARKWIGRYRLEGVAGLVIARRRRDGWLTARLKIASRRS